MSDSGSAYTKACKEWRAAAVEAAALSKLISTTGAALREHPIGLVVAAPGEPTPLPRPRARESSRLDPAEWPSAVQIADVAARYRAAYDAMWETWQAVPQEDRIASQDPQKVVNDFRSPGR